MIAAYTAKMQGKSVLLIEPTDHLGGLSSGGLGYTDIGNKYAITGLALDFYRRLGDHYGKLEQWIFEPHVAESLFVAYLDEAEVEVLYRHRITGVEKDGEFIRQISLESTERPGASAPETYSARMFIDCSYEGDLMAKAGVSYTVGREANSRYGETYNGVQLMTGHQFPDGIDPYKIPGDSTSGLLWGISAEPLQPDGTGDKKVQAYNYRICLTDNPDNRIPVTRPENYDSTRYDLLARLMEAQPERRSLNDYFIWSRMPNDKTDINNRNGFSTDMIGMNHDYPEADYDERAAIIKAHEDYTKGLLYFCGHDPRVPEELREEMRRWGYPKDEYTDNGHWSPQLYVREVRRMVGEYVMTQANCVGKETVTDGVGMAAYTMDSHNCQRIVIEKDGKKMVKNEGNVEIGGFGPYPVSYRSLIPKAGECRNLLVPVCLSASHIAYGSIRMEPVFMALAQAAATAASLAVDGGLSVQEVEVNKLQELLRTDPLADGSTPEIQVDNRDTAYLSVQGEWKSFGKGSFGPDMLVAGPNGGADRSVRFSPEIAESGDYAVYVYYPNLPDGAAQTFLEVFDGEASREIIIKKKEVEIEGQTSGEWISLGTYSLPQGNKTYVEISGKGTGGSVAADAMRWIPE